MSIEAIAYAKQLELGEAEGATARLLLYVIAENTFNDTFVCRLCQAQLAYEAGRISERTVSRHLEALERAKLILRPAAERDDDGRRLSRRRNKDGQVEPDVVRLVGFKRWYFRDHVTPRKSPKRRKPADNLSGGGNPDAGAAPADKLSGGQRTTCPEATGQQCPEATGQQVSLGNSSRTSTSRTSPPSAPNFSTAAAQPASAGGRGDSSSGWHRGWPADARQAFDELRWSSDPAIADVADRFLDRVRGMLPPPKGVDPASYVRECGTRLGVFDGERLARLADQQLAERTHWLDPVPKLEALARGGAGVATPKADVLGVQISRNAEAPADAYAPDAVAAWIAYAAGPAGRADRAVRVIGDMLAKFGAGLVPSRYPPQPALASDGAAA